ncbi:IS3 family transposase [Dyadobacter sediminis]|uniref:IS3 family transposase n=1 Tax=Dyadobacter sediminis TaxID=1493691 RepID=A0A5R9KQ96_9BACT|nr:IS3 family transposase [Dyadobacter sediminis]TLU98360.1 IS3 family transposase [Dyadobacter sediminis]GGC14589.1 integrase [Dyadobacter sediminis]
MKERIALIDSSHPLSIRRQSEILSINRSQLYYRPAGEKEENLVLMETMDKLFLSDPTLGVLGMQDELAEKGLDYNVKRIRRLMRKMAIEPIYPKRNLSRLGKAKYIHPYLLRGLQINRPNQVWAMDISYIPMKHGFMYLTAIIDLYSRYIVGWQLSNSLEKQTQTELLHATICKYGKPEIINTDQGSQYTCEHWVSTLNDLKIRISMDGKGRATDNAFIERWFRTIKQKYIYLNPEKNGLDLYQGIDRFVKRYNSRKHQGIGRKKPVNLYLNAA